MRIPRTGTFVVALLLAAGLAACTGDDPPPAEQQAAKTFLDALGARDASKAAAATSDATQARATITASLTGLGRTARGEFAVTKSSVDGDRATVPFSADWTLAGGVRWRYAGTLSLARSQDSWRVSWRADALHPKLATGHHLQVVQVQPERGALQDSAGRALFAPTPVVTVGLEKRRVRNLPNLARTLAAIPELDSTRAEIERAVKAAGPTEFVPLITLRRPVYEQIKPRIYNLAGTVFQSETRQLAPSASFGAQLLGRVGEPTAEMVQKSNGRLTAGQPTGVGGLQQALDTTLAGTVGVAVDAVPDGGGDATQLATVTAPKPGKPVRLTLDRKVQTAAEAALAQVGAKASVVAVQPSTGRILADANTSSVTYDFGLAGAFPPGSTFKIATWTAAFTAEPSLTPASTVRCPATVTVDGRRFENENKFSYPPVPVADAFGYSCNTSAIDVALRLPKSAIGDAAKTLGLGGKWDLPVDAYAGSVPPPASETERAADAIGQGRVLASPLLMALLAGSAETGKVFAPTLTTDADAKQTGTVPAGIVAKMRKLMAATVQLPAGTGHTLDGLGGVVGKTGTAEYGDAKPPRAHSWFAGVRGDVALAVFVYDGQSNGTVAVPIARKFLQQLG